MMKDKTILVTGSTDGIGKQTAFQLAGLGATVILHFGVSWLLWLNLFHGCFVCHVRVTSQSSLLNRAVDTDVCTAFLRRCGAIACAIVIYDG